jgi:formylglycine-generating enzyme required for sulfatase activity
MSHFCSLMDKEIFLRTLAIGTGIVALLGLYVEPTLAQHNTPENIEALQQLSDRFTREAEARRTPLYYNLLSMTTGTQGTLNLDPTIQLMGIDDRGFPIFYSDFNLDAAETISIVNVWPGGSSDFNLTGSNVLGELGIWEKSAVRITHQEFGGRVTRGDGASVTSSHATHVAGTLIATGIDPSAKGMSYAANLVSYDNYEDYTEMAQAASVNLLVSNHSYGYPTGWEDTGENWRWHGDISISQIEDFGFGFYSWGAMNLDLITINASYYLIVKAAGNDRNDEGPGPGGLHQIWDPDESEWVWSTETRDPDGGEDGYDTVTYLGNAKNILTVGAVEDILGGYQTPTDVVMSDYSGWGPTDDGRIKPDLVASGDGLWSSSNNTDSDYSVMWGTSMASPCVAGSAHLLQQQHMALNSGVPMRAATLKALLINTADEAGAFDGPDYRFGWGLVNTRTAASLIANHAESGSVLHELSLTNGQTYSRDFLYDGSEPISVTLAWTDPAGTPPEYEVDPTGFMLVNDLDLRVERVQDGTVFEPWILNPTPELEGNPASNGDNFRDNVEQVEPYVSSAGVYRVTVTHKGVLDESQDFSLVVRGLTINTPSPPSVANVFASQRTDGSGVVEITYDLTDLDSSSLEISLKASDDEGVTWNLAISQVGGDVGQGINPGSGKLVYWDFSNEHPEQYGEAYVVRVTAEDQPLGSFVSIPTGTFVMGAPIDEVGDYPNERPQHSVTLTHSFYIQSTEVTNQQYMEMAQWAYDYGYVTATSNSLRDALDGSTQELLDLDGDFCEIQFSGGVFSLRNVGYEINPDHPVKEVTWYGSAAYCDWLSLQEGLPRAYDHASWQCNGHDPYNAAGYRLPTEAEWEYACRAGSQTAFANGGITYTGCNPLDPILDQIGWYCGNNEGWTSPVAQKIPNAWGLYDMHGNLFEWCNDWYSSYESSPIHDPVGPLDGVGRVKRGGFWESSLAEHCRSAYRFGYGPRISNYRIGFRPVRTAD